MRLKFRSLGSDGGKSGFTDPVFSPGACRRSKWEFEEELKTACNHNVVVMSGAEANGYGEIKYGAGKDLNGLVLMITLGRGFGALLLSGPSLRQ